MVEQVTLNHWVHGSSPCTPTIFQKAGSSRPFLFLPFPPLHEDTVAQGPMLSGEKRRTAKTRLLQERWALRRAHVRAPSRAPLSCANIPFKRPKREVRWAHASRFAGETPADRSLPPIAFALEGEKQRPRASQSANQEMQEMQEMQDRPCGATDGTSPSVAPPTRQASTLAV